MEKNLSFLLRGFPVFERKWGQRQSRRGRSIKGKPRTRGHWLMTPYSGHGPGGDRGMVARLTVLAYHGRHDLGSPVTHRIARDRTRSRLPWGLLFVLELSGRPTRCPCDRLLRQ